MSEKNIYQKMAAVTAALKTVGKNLAVGTGRSSYKAVSERDIIDAVKPAEEHEGIYSYPSARELIESRIIEREGANPIYFTRYKTTYAFVNMDKPEEKIEMVTFSEGIDTGDKGSGKAMTYGDKYALMKAYKISTGEDPDQEASPEEEPKPRPENTGSIITGPINADQVSNLEKLIRDSGTNRDALITWIRETWHKGGLEDLTMREYSALFEKLNERLKEKYFSKEEA